MECGSDHVWPPSIDSVCRISRALSWLWLRMWTTIRPLFDSTACNSWYSRWLSPDRVGMSANQACAVVRARLPSFKADIAIVLGSGLSDLVDVLEQPAIIDYRALPGFPEPGVVGHGGRLHLGLVAGQGVLFFQGRAHFYESGRADAMAVPIGLAAALGADRLILTNAAGSLRPDAGPGSLMLITDHINLTGANPLVGGPGGPAFIDLSALYDRDLAAGLEQAAVQVGVALRQGVYMRFSGPSFETPAEIRAARLLGADAVGIGSPESVSSSWGSSAGASPR